MFPLRLCAGTLLVAVTRERRYGPSRLLIIIGIPSPTHSFTLGLNPSFSANPPYPSLSFSHSGFTIWISQTVYFTSEHIGLFTF